MKLKKTLPKIILVLTYWVGAFTAFYAVDYWFGYGWGIAFLYIAPWPLFLLLLDWRNTRRTQKRRDAEFGSMSGWEKRAPWAEIRTDWPSHGEWHKPNPENKITEWTENRDAAMQQVKSVKQDGTRSEKEKEMLSAYWADLLAGAEEEVAYWSALARWEELPQSTRDDFGEPELPERHRRNNNWGQVKHLLHERSYPPGYRRRRWGT